MASLQSPPISPASSQQEASSIPYLAEFTDALMRTILSPSHSSGIAVLERGARTNPVEGSSVRFEDAQPPHIDTSELPLALDDPRRVYESAVPGVKVTHPGGRLEGGLHVEDPEMLPDAGDAFPAELRQFAQDIIKDNKMTTQTQLRNYITNQIKQQKGELTRRMAERQNAVNHNEKLDRDIKQMEDQRALERRVEAMSRRDG